MPYLLAAEADKIQDIIFRSSRLRQVTGASWMLTSFTRKGIDPLLKKYHGKVVVKDGGGFRIIFEKEDEAKAFADDLAEMYRKTLGGSLSVAEPVLLEDDFRKANETASKRLLRVKEHRKGVEDNSHMPFVAYCASCGVALAESYTVLSGEKEGRAQYLCETCIRKAEFRESYKAQYMAEFAKLIGKDWQVIDRFDWPLDASDVSKYDLSNRQYVAYLLADGNNMGQIFGKCNQTQLTKLSQQLPQIVLESIAEPTELLMRRLVEAEVLEFWKVPIIPLILGGDDVFVLLPAPYALDFAQQFALAFENKMQALLQDPVFEGLSAPSPTMSVAVMFCKGKYPYSLAHQRGETLLKEAKKMNKRLAAESGQYLSVINFEIIQGNQMPENDHSKEQFVTTLRPYWITDEAIQSSEKASPYGVGIQTILEQRFALRHISTKRLHEIRRIFSPQNLPSIPHPSQMNVALEPWFTKLRRVLNRSKQYDALDASLRALGGEPEMSYWRQIDRGYNAIYKANGILDLILAWSFAQDLDHAPWEYEPQEEE